MRQLIQQAADAIVSADTLLITAGAGMGVDSGLPDFRGDTGFWQAYPVLKEEGVSFYELANPIWFRTDPARAWGFYGHRYFLYRQTVPHRGFQILQKWAAAKPIAPFVFTSNVDGHFQKAGFAADSVYECHGSINHLQCQKHCNVETHTQIWEMPATQFSVDAERLIASGELPTCPTCGSIARPNILMFGDFDWLSSRTDAQYARLQAWQRALAGKHIVTIEMGAGKAIPTVRMASDAMRGKTIRINPREADGNHQTISLAMGALEALALIDECL